MERFKIALGVPTNRLIKPKTAASVMNLIAHSQHEFEIIVSTRGYNTSENRNWIAAQAVKKGCEYLFFVDDDMILPKEALERLLVAQKDIIGGVYMTKYEIQDYVYELLPGTKPGKDIFEVAAIGTGAMLIKTEVFKKLPQPWFKYEWTKEGAVKRSHDWIFCEDARNAGIKVWADPTITVGHIGQYEY
jgi:hypothetical protein